MRAPGIALALWMAGAACLAQPSAEERVPPRFLAESSCRPEYPAASRKREEEGTVRLRLRIDADGLPTEIRIETSSGFPRLDKAAMDAATCFRYTPGSVNGVPAAVWLNAPVRFVLQ